MKIRIFGVPFLCLFFSACTKQVGMPLRADTDMIDSTITLTRLCTYDTVSVVSYSKDIQGVMKTYCLNCHSKPGAGGVELDTYDLVRAFTQSGDMLRVTACTPGEICMPPQPAAALDTCSLRGIQRWMALGYLK